MLGVFVLGKTLYAQGTDSRIGSIKHERVEHGATPATAITKAEADKKYPSKSKTYPAGTRDAHDPSGVVSAHIRRTKSITARRSHTAGWLLMLM